MNVTRPKPPLPRFLNSSATIALLFTNWTRGTSWNIYNVYNVIIHVWFYSRTIDWPQVRCPLTPLQSHEREVGKIRRYSIISSIIVRMIELSTNHLLVCWNNSWRKENKNTMTTQWLTLIISARLPATSLRLVSDLPADGETRGLQRW